MIDIRDKRGRFDVALIFCCGCVLLLWIIESSSLFFAGVPERAAAAGTNLTDLAVLFAVVGMSYGLVRRTSPAADGLAEACERPGDTRGPEPDSSTHLRRQQLRLRGQAEWEYQPDDGSVWFSDGWFAALGYERNDLPMTFRAWRSLVHLDDAEVLFDALHECVEGRCDRFDASARMRTKDGEWRWVRTIGECTDDPAGDGSAISGIALDIDTDYRLGEQLRRHNEELEHFVYSASHDLKSPIVTMLGFLGHASSCLEAGDVAPARRYIGIAEDAGNRMRAIVEDLLEVSRVGSMRFHPTRVDLSGAIEEIESMYRDAIAEKGARIECALDAPDVWCDRRHVVSALSNLVGNALHHAAPDGAREHAADGTPEIAEQGEPLVIEIRSRETLGGSIRIDVRDNGIGVDPRAAEQIFQMFERGSTNAEGTGLGLAIVSRIADVWGGAAWLEPTDRGACFSVTFSNRERGRLLGESKNQTGFEKTRRTYDDIIGHAADAGQVPGWFGRRVG